MAWEDKLKSSSKEVNIHPARLWHNVLRVFISVSVIRLFQCLVRLVRACASDCPYSALCRAAAPTCFGHSTPVFGFPFPPSLPANNIFATKITPRRFAFPRRVRHAGRSWSARAPAPLFHPSPPCCLVWRHESSLHNADARAARAARIAAGQPPVVLTSRPLPSASRRRIREP